MEDQKKLEQLRQALQEWEQACLNKTLAELPERQASFITTSSETGGKAVHPTEPGRFRLPDRPGLPG